MNLIRAIRRLAYILTALATAAAAFTATAPAAFAMVPLPPGNPRIHAQAQMHVIAAGGMPGWQITLIAAGAALLTATVAVLADRARSDRRRAATSPA